MSGSTPSNDSTSSKPQSSLTKPPQSAQISTSSKLTLAKLGKLTDFLLFDLPPNVKILKANTVILLIRLLTLPLYLFLMYEYQNFSMVSYVTLATHGAYAFTWIAKIFIFPDKNLENKVGLGSLPFTAAYFAIYWYFAFLTFSKAGGQFPTGDRLFFSVAFTALGSMLFFCADAQKNFALKFKSDLVNEAYFKCTRNPNYLGEMMVSAAFAALANREIAWYVVIAMWVLVFWPRMKQKDEALKAKSGWETYRANTYILVPKLCSLNFINWFLYGVGILGLYAVGHSGLIEMLKK